MSSEATFQKYAHDWGIIERGVIAGTLILLVMGQIILIQDIGSGKELELLWKIFAPLIMFMYFKPYIYAQIDVLWGWYKDE